MNYKKWLIAAVLSTLLSIICFLGETKYTSVTATLGVIFAVAAVYSLNKATKV
jgi:hypothetical protein